MEYLLYRGITYELAILALAHEDGFSIELADVSSAGDLLAEVRVRGDVITPVHHAPIPAAVYAWWAATVVRVAEAPALEDGADA